MLKKQLIEGARELGFALCRVTTAEPVSCAELVSWLYKGRHGAMHWMARAPAARCNPASLLAGARSVICCALPYGDQGLFRWKSGGGGTPFTGSPGARKSTGSCCPEGNRERCPADMPDFHLTDTSLPDSEYSKNARFARGEDYHVVMREKLEQLAGLLSAMAAGAKTICCVDTSPLMEKALAARAGVGWVGKHTLLVNPQYGSWFVLGEVITDVELPPDTSIENRCGHCQRCRQVCPTGALDEYSLDARRCISYLTTVRHGGAIDKEFKSFVGHSTYGCDRCQEVCPYNYKLPCCEEVA